MKKILVSLFFITCSLFGITLDQANMMIKDEKIPWLKQKYICERDATLNVKYGSADECLKAADMILALKGKKLSDREYIFLEKGIEINSAECFFNAGVIYYNGDVAKNHIKAYEHFKEALKLGLPNAQNAIETVCKKSPWACK